MKETIAISERIRLVVESRADGFPLRIEAFCKYGGFKQSWRSVANFGSYDGASLSLGSSTCLPSDINDALIMIDAYAAMGEKARRMLSDFVELAT